MAYPLSKEDIEHYMNEGHQAFNSKMKTADNPYSKFNEKGRLWLKGYANAHYGANYANMHARNV